MGTTPNIFEALTSFGHRIQEDNYSDFLAFLLNPNSDEKLGDKFLKSFISKIKIDKSIKEVSKLQLANISIFREVPYQNKRWIDIVVNTDINGVKYKLCIECKTNSASNNDNQLEEEYEFCKKDNDNVKICLIYLTPSHKNYKKKLDNLEIDQEDSKKWITWDKINPNKDFYKKFCNNIKSQEVISIIDIIDDIDSGRDYIYKFKKHLEKDFIIKESIERHINRKKYRIIQYYNNSTEVLIDGYKPKKKQKMEISLRKQLSY